MRNMVSFEREIEDITFTYNYYPDDEQGQLTFEINGDCGDSAEVQIGVETEYDNGFVKPYFDNKFLLRVLNSDFENEIVEWLTEEMTEEMEVYARQYAQEDIAEWEAWNNS